MWCPNLNGALKTVLYAWAGLLLGVLMVPRAAFASDGSNTSVFYHCVSSGESLNKIAQHYLSLTDAITLGELVRKIRQLNGIQGSVIYPDQRLLIPLAESSPIKATRAPKKPDYEVRGIYMNRYSMACEKMTRLLNQLLSSGGNTVVLDGKDMTGRLSYPSRVVLANEIGATANPVIGNLPRLFNHLHQRGLHVCVRLVLFYDPLLAAKKPELALNPIRPDDQQQEATKTVWVNPGHSIVQEYNLDIARELAEMGVDEIQFDYVRFPTFSTVVDGECHQGQPALTRHNVITNFLAQARTALAPYEVLLSLDVFGIIAWGRLEDMEMTGQKIRDLAEQCDVICPMIYPSHFHKPFQTIADPGTEPFLMVSETCRRFDSLLKDSKTRLRPWIQAFPYGVENFSEQYILEQLRAVDQPSSRGWMLWSAGNAYDVAWKALSQLNNERLDTKTASAKFLLYY
jgi:hypothetical protein